MSEPSISPEIKEALSQQGKTDLTKGIQHLFESDDGRAERFSYDLKDIFFDFSKTHISDELLKTYLQFAKEVDLESKRHALFSGEKINITEGRSVLHPLLRDAQNQGITTDEDLTDQAINARDKFFQQCEKIEASLSARQTSVRSIIHVGIGGSVLGTQLLYEALKSLTNEIKIHFVSNIDGHQLMTVLAQCEPSETIVIGVSKTFTTQETKQNLNSISDWYEQAEITDYKQYFYAVSASPKDAISFGIKADNVVDFPQWVGGRYSVWSAVSLSSVIVLGKAKFEEFLSGGALIDQHFYKTNLADNVCFIAAMLDHYSTNFLQTSSKAIFAYDARLEKLVDYLQQLETESNGKDRQLDGSLVDQKTSPVVWGGVGTDVQHSVFQMLHQGSAVIPAEFIMIKKPDHKLEQHHKTLLANGVAQTAALLTGQDIDTVRQIHASEKLSESVLKSKVFSGERPSSTILVNKLTPKSLGMLLAFYEHRVFCNGVFSNINSYDQMGVELGKRLANEVLPNLNNKETNELQSFDQSTQQLINLLND